MENVNNTTQIANLDLLPPKPEKRVGYAHLTLRT